jgi:hypothetical protein
VDWNDQGGVAVKFQKETDYRTMLTMATSMVPEVGQVLSGVIKLLWEDKTPDSLFGQMKEYVDRLVPALIAKDKVGRLEGRIEGLQNLMRDYNNTKVLEEKKDRLMGIISQFAMAEPEFFSTPSPNEVPRPEQVLAYFVAFGTTYLVALRELYLHGTEYYGSNADQQQHLTSLQEAIQRYTSAAADIKQRIMDWRLSTLNKYQYNVWNSPGPASAFGLGGDTIYYVSDDLCGWRKEVGGDKDAREQVFAERWEQVKAAYGADLDVILSPLTNWARLADPSQIPAPSKIGHAG